MTIRVTDGVVQLGIYLECHCERCLVDEPAPRRVDQEGARPHLLDGVLVDEVVVVLVERAVQRHAVRLEEQVLWTERKFCNCSITQSLFMKLPVACIRAPARTTSRCRPAGTGRRR